MPISSESYEVANLELVIGKVELKVRTLKDRQQYYDPLGVAEDIGISSATWSLFGVVWPSAMVLAKIIENMSLDGFNILELGCGIALPGLVASKTGGKVTVSDYHPLAQSFLNKNTELNNLPTINYLNCDWRNPITLFGRFNLIIASDVLYERDHPEQLATYIDCHSTDCAKVIVVDPKRKHGGKFVKLMKKNGFHSDSEVIISQEILGQNYKGIVYSFTRNLD